MAEERVSLEEQLTSDGWNKRFMGVGQRLEEMVAYYRELGFEVHLEPVDVDELPHEVCNECFLVKSNLYKTIYTRLK